MGNFILLFTLFGATVDVLYGSVEVGVSLELSVVISNCSVVFTGVKVLEVAKNDVLTIAKYKF